ncbi:MAG: LPS assembly lipoprotein LptE [bacterium]
MGIKKYICLFFLVWLFVAACGYRFAGNGEFPEETNRIFVEVLENRTSETGVENIVTSELLKEFTLRKTNNLAGSPDDADALLSGVIQFVIIQTISPKGKDAASERRVTVTVDLKLAQKDGQVIWTAKSLTDNEGYKIDENKERTEQNKREALRVLSQRIAERTMNRLSDDF